MPKLWSTLHPRLLLALAALIAGLGFWWVGALVRFPQHPGFNASLLLQPTPAAKVIAVVVAAGVLTLLCTLLAGRVRYDAGWGCVALGLYALRLRGGPMWTTLDDRSPGVFLTLAIELALLGIVLSAAWAVVHILRERGTSSSALRRVLELPDARTRIADRKATDESLDQKLLAVAINAGTMAVLMVLLCRSDARAQVFFSVGISAYLATWITHVFIPTRPGAWFWSGPLVCGLIGYLWAWWSTPQPLLNIGQPGGFLAPLARPLPLDYASIGVAAALWRYVSSRTHQMQRVAEAQRQEAAKPAPATA